MDSDDLPLNRSADPLVLAGAQDLDPLSVHELEARIARLEGEIARVRRRLDRVVNHRASADALFRR